MQICFLSMERGTCEGHCVRVGCFQWLSVVFSGFHCFASGLPGASWGAFGHLCFWPPSRHFAGHVPKRLAAMEKLKPKNQGQRSWQTHTTQGLQWFLTLIKLLGIEKYYIYEVKSFKNLEILIFFSMRYS